MARRRSGWFKLRSGRLFYGQIPAGVEEAPAPDAPADAPAVQVEQGPERPADSAAKQAWVDYARQVDVDPDGLTKAEIVAAVDALGDQVVETGDSSGEVGSVALGDEQVADPPQVAKRHRRHRS